jgi:uncharacterized protein
LIYIDTSALLKLIHDEEAEAAALHEYLASAGDTALVSSGLITVEARRGVMRANPNRLPRVDMMLIEVITIPMSDTVIERASHLPDPLLRSLDAIHLATALLIREDVEALLTYDERLARAAQAHNIEVAAPA